MRGVIIKAVSLVLNLILTLTLFSGVGIAYAANSTSTGSNVLTDLYQDTSFNGNLYKFDANDCGLNVIQIAESTCGELLIYLYQPSGTARDLRASSINISRYEDGAAASFKNYKLKLENSYHVFFKYKVQGFVLEKSPRRIYNISQIMRPYDKAIDPAPAGGNTVSEVPFKVAQCWSAAGTGEVTYKMTASEVVTIKDKLCGYINYNDGANLGWAVTSGATSAHFVAFDTDRKIDKLRSASITFGEQEVTYKMCANPLHFQHELNAKFDYKYGEKKAHEPNPLILKADQTANNPGGGSINPGKKYTWKRIQNTSEFLKDKNQADIALSAGSLADVAKIKWVLNFYETAVSVKTDNVWTPLISWIAIPFVGDAEIKQTRVSDVMILQLEFETDGKVYNLGCIDNRQTGKDSPLGSNINSDNGVPWWVWLIVGAIALVIICAIFPPVGRAILVIITAPFKLLARLFGGNGDEEKEKELKYANEKSKTIAAKREARKRREAQPAKQTKAKRG